MNPYDRTPAPPPDEKLIAVLWSATKADRRAVCVLWHHAIGFEARVDVDDETRQTAAFRMRVNAEDQADDWLQAFKGKGWE